MFKRLLQKRRQKNNFIEKPVSINYDSKINNCYIGKYSYIGSKCDLNRTKVGRYCSIAQRIKIVSGFHPSSIYVSTHPVFYSNTNPSIIEMDYILADKNYYDEHRFSELGFYVTIGSDVWVGSDVIILAGVTIGHGAIIASGAVVVKDVLPYQVVGGVPAKEICFRFNDSEIAFLLKDEWWNKSSDFIKCNYKKFHSVGDYIEFMRLENDL